MVYPGKWCLLCGLGLMMSLAACGDDEKEPPSAMVEPDMGADSVEDAADEPDSGDVPDLMQDVSPEDMVDVPDMTPDVGDADMVDMVEEDMGPEPEVFPGWAEVPVAPMMWVDGLPLIEVQASSQGEDMVLIDEPQPYVMDTLAQTFFVDDEIAGDLLFHEFDITLGGRALGRFPIKGRDMTPDETTLGVDIGGLVGQLYFGNRFTVFDYPQRQFLLADAAPPPELPPPGYEDAPRAEALYDLPNLFPIVTTEVGAAGEVRLLGDTSSRMTFITQRVFDAIDDGSLPRVEGYRFQTNFGEDPGFLTRLPELRLGEVVVRDLEAVIIPDDNHIVGLLRGNGVEMEGFLGAGFWSRFAVGLDGHTFSFDSGSEGGLKKLIFWGDGAPLEAWEGRWTRVAVELTQRQGEIQCEMVFTDSAAQAAGLVPGTVLMGIDGTPVMDLTLTQARAMLQGELDQTRTLLIRLPDSEEEIEVTVAIEEVLP